MRVSFIVARLRSIDVHGDVHGMHPERESQANKGEGSELCGAAYEPCDTEDNRPYDSDSNDIYNEWKTIRTPVQPRGKTHNVKDDGGSTDASFKCVHRF